MNKTIIAIYGRKNEGKSETIKNVCKLILEAFPNAKCSKSDINYKKDILLTIQLGKIKIGFESQGDPISRMINEDTIRKLADPIDDKGIGGCDIIICATRTYGKTVNTVDDVANKFGFKLLWLSSFWGPELNHDVLNRKAANNIIDIIKSIAIGQL